MSRRGVLARFGVAFFVSMGIYGCPPPDVLNEAMDVKMLAGGNEQRLVFTRVDMPDLPAIDPLSFVLNPQQAGAQLQDVYQANPPTLQVVVVDIASLQATVLPAPIPEGYSFPLTDGTWIVWQDYENGVVHTYKIDTGETSDLNLGPAAQGSYLSQLEDGKLLMEFARGGQSLPLVVDLATGEQKLIGGNLSPSVSLLKGDSLLVQYYPGLPGTPGVLEELENTSLDGAMETNIDLFDLASGQTRTLVSNISSGLLAGFVGERVAWTETSADGATATVQLYDLNTGQTQDLFQFAPGSPETDSTSIAGVGEPGILVSTYSSSQDGASSRAVWELHAPDGSVQTVLDYTQTFVPFDFSSISTVSPMPVIVENLIVYQDPDTADWMLYEPATQTRRSFEPFQ